MDVPVRICPLSSLQCQQLPVQASSAAPLNNLGTCHTRPETLLTLAVLAGSDRIAQACLRRLRRLHPSFGRPRARLVCCASVGVTEEGSNVRGAEETSSSALEGSIESALAVQLEAQMQAAVKKEDFVEAARLRDKIKAFSLEEEAAVISANRAFFKAYRSRDLTGMRELWQAGEHACCMHAKERPVHGHKAVMASWARVFRQRTKSVNCSKQTVALRNGTGRVVTIDDDANTVITNLFEHTANGWKLWSHQAGPLNPAEEQKSSPFLAAMMPRRLWEFFSEAWQRRKVQRARKKLIELEEKQLQLARLVLSPNAHRS
eukprot:TRINITY_DN52497_c0_g1_i1.p1 TRINITY_DN52497_c0_g1~~TRINITY_DN52497_c0_g1_i1.p1  ORF type:complete len:318 (-),score=59.68 TRINITY_DN52497_c0_g1_i1:18-971(-)